MRLKSLIVLAVTTLLGCAGLRAGEGPLRRQMENGGPFDKGAHEFQNVAGAFFFFDTTQNNRPAVGYAVESARLGWMTYSPSGPGLLRGNFELLGEAFAGGIFDGPGDVLAGLSLLFRYNFVQPNALIVPYVQFGGGGVYTNISERESNGLISLPVEFNLQASIGSRFMISSRWSVVAECTYRHISNATIQSPNYGIDTLGGSLGFGVSF
ncbi:MAG: acyloxyacyl hydrolase [Verrucomicrobiota bacterium]|nr:acyloxyacyl hydrolase [Verrucomicrobiota bacterium]